MANDDVARLKSELALAELSEEYDALQKKMGPKSSDADKERYRDLAEQVTKARGEHRKKFRPTGGAEGDGVAQVETVHTGATVKGE